MTNVTEKDVQDVTVEQEKDSLDQENSAENVNEEPQDGSLDSQNEEQVHNESEADQEIKALEEKVASLEADKEALNNRLLRVQADFENFKRRVREEKAKDRQFRAQDLIEDLLPIADNFSRALDSEVESEEARTLKQGVEMVYRQFIDALTKEGVEEINGLHQPFDPNEHQAVMQDEGTDHEPNTITQVLQKGYKLNGRVLRPAMVKVSS